MAFHQSIKYFSLYNFVLYVSYPHLWLNSGQDRLNWCSSPIRILHVPCLLEESLYYCSVPLTGYIVVSCISLSQLQVVLRIPMSCHPQNHWFLGFICQVAETTSITHQLSIQMGSKSPCMNLVLQYHLMNKNSQIQKSHAFENIL